MRLPFDNLALKAASVALAALLWYVIAGEKTSEMGLVVPVELQNFPQDLELTGEPVNAVEVRLRASPGIIQRITPGDVSARLDLAGVREGEHIVHLTAASIRVPFGVRVIRVNPATITLNFEPTLQKTVPVRPRLTGRPAPGFEVVEVGGEPAEIRVAGPRSRIQEVESAFTAPVSVEGARQAVSEEVSIGLEDPLVRVLGSSRVTVTAQVREAMATRLFEDVELAVRGGNGTAQPARVDVTIAGPALALQQVQPSQVIAYADAARARGRSAVPVAVELEGGPAGVTVKACTPDQVALRPARRTRR